MVTSGERCSRTARNTSAIGRSWIISAIADSIPAMLPSARVAVAASPIHGGHDREHPEHDEDPDRADRAGSSCPRARRSRVATGAAAAVALFELADPPAANRRLAKITISHGATIAHSPMTRNIQTRRGSAPLADCGSTTSGTNARIRLSPPTTTRAQPGDVAGQPDGGQLGLVEARAHVRSVPARMPMSRPGGSARSRPRSPGWAPGRRGRVAPRGCLLPPGDQHDAPRPPRPTAGPTNQTRW